MQKIKKIKETSGFIPAVKTLSKSIREYKLPSLLAPIFVAMEVVVECLIPYIMTLLLGAIEFIAGKPKTPNPISVSIINFLFGDKEPQLLTTILHLYFV